MTAKIHITILTTFLLSNSAWADSPRLPIIETASLTTMALEINARNYRSKVPPTIKAPSIPFTHEREKNNSLYSAVLAKQGVKINLIINSESKITSTRPSYKNERTNSLFGRVLAR